MKTNDSYVQRTGPGEVTLIRLLPGPIERVWQFLVDPAKRAKWFASGPLEPQQGGAIKMRFHHADLSDEKVAPPKYAHMQEGVDSTGTVSHFEPPHTFGFLWDEGEGTPPSQVIFRLSPEGDKVKLVLTHSRLSSKDSEHSVSSGWHAHVEVLATLLDDEEPKGFWTRLMELETIYARQLDEGKAGV